MIFENKDKVYYFFENEYLVREGYVVSKDTDSGNKDFFLEVHGLPPFYIWDIACEQENLVHIKQYSLDGTLEVLNIYIGHDKKEMIIQANKAATDKIAFITDMINQNNETFYTE